MCPLNKEAHAAVSRLGLRVFDKLSLLLVVIVCLHLKLLWDADQLNSSLSDYVLQHSRRSLTTGSRVEKKGLHCPASIPQLAIPQHRILHVENRTREDGSLSNSFQNCIERGVAS